MEPHKYVGEMMIGRQTKPRFELPFREATGAFGCGFAGYPARADDSWQAHGQRMSNWTEIESGRP
jgi:hypothetical protein